MYFDFVIVGAGLAGSTLAERVANVLGKRVLLVEQRNHVGGNTYDHYDEHGVLVQKYGPHIFHSTSGRVWEYLSRFTEWNDYVHRVLASVKDKEVYLPINLETMEQLYGRDFTPETMQEFLDQMKVDMKEVRNSRDVVVSQVGEEIYDLFFKNYTKKQWGVYPEELDAQVTKRLPVRFNRDTRYFSDSYQGIPKSGFTRMFDRMLQSSNIHILLNTDYRDVVPHIEFGSMIYTGPIDQYFGYRYGRLPYRSLHFDFEYIETEQYQNGAVVNFPNDHDYTRITEFKHFYFQRHHGTTICKEYPSSEGDPYYPIPAQEHQATYEKYRKDAESLPKVYFVGRLAEYRYLNMDQVVERALDVFDEIADTTVNAARRAL